jgi:hypothetical protein
MAVYKIFPIKDAAIYSGYPNMNTGLDQIIESSTNFYINNPQSTGPVPQSSRYLIQFDQNEITNTINNIISGSSYDTYLRVFQALIKGLNNDTSVYINAVSEPWAMGSGYFLVNPEVDNGVSWKNTINSTSFWTTSSYPSGTTGSYNLTTNPNSNGGGVWYTGSQAYQTFNYYSDLDINSNVTNIVNNWYTNTFNNYGFILRQYENQEFVNDINQQVEMKYFSVDTNTIYPPQLEFRWNDYIFNTGSSNNLILSTPDALISLSDNLKFYYTESIAKFRINATPKYPVKTFMTSSYYVKNYYLPEDVSLYAIKDTETNEFVIDFDANYTKISADGKSSYFKVYMNGLQPERNYTILIKTIIDDNTIVFDENIIFKVINGK